MISSFDFVRFLSITSEIIINSGFKTIGEFGLFQRLILLNSLSKSLEISLANLGVVKNNERIKHSIPNQFVTNED